MPHSKNNLILNNCILFFRVLHQIYTGRVAAWRQKTIQPIIIVHFVHTGCGATWHNKPIKTSSLSFRVIYIITVLFLDSDWSTAVAVYSQSGTLFSSGRKALSHFTSWKLHWYIFFGFNICFPLHVVLNNVLKQRFIRNKTQPLVPYCSHIYFIYSYLFTFHILSGKRKLKVNKQMIIS